MYQASPELIAEIVSEIHRSFGGGRTSDNPIAHAMADKPASFALGVPVLDVVHSVQRHRHGFHPRSEFFVNKHGDERRELIEFMPDGETVVSHYHDGRHYHCFWRQNDPDFIQDYKLATDDDLRAFLS